MKAYSRWPAITGLAAALLCAWAGAVQAQSPGMARFDAGKLALEKGDFDAATDAFGDAIKADGDNAQYHLWLGNAYAQEALRSGVFTQARLAPRIRDEWMRAAALDPTSYDAHEHLYEFYTQAPGLMGGSADRAAKELTEMVRLNPYRAEFTLAERDFNAKRYADGESRMRTLAATHPDSTEPLEVLALAQQNLKRYDDAWTTLDAAHARFPNDAMINYLIGRGASLAGTRLDAGQAALEHVIAAPGTLDLMHLSLARYRLGTILDRKGDKAGARTQYGAAIRIEPRNVDAKKALEKLGAR